MLIDTHAHLMFPEFNYDLENVIKRAREAGLVKIVNVGCSKESSSQAVEMAKAHSSDGGDFLYATLGLHPYEALDLTDELIEKWEKWILEDKENFEKGGVRKIVAIGEIGLDYFKATIGHSEQKEAFRKQLKVASRFDLPVIVHNRVADEDCLEILKGFAGVRAVFHCFGSSLEFAKKVWEAGFMTSFTGIVTYPNAKDLRDVVKEVPLDKFMLETDCPYLAPQAYRGKRNEPAYVLETAKMVAEIRSIELAEVEKLAVENSKRFFGF